MEAPECGHERVPILDAPGSAVTVIQGSPKLTMDFCKLLMSRAAPAASFSLSCFVHSFFECY